MAPPPLADTDGIANVEPDVTDADTQVWVRRAIIVSWVSIVITVASGVAGLTIFAVAHSSAMLGYGLESFVDVFSSAVIVWRCLV